MKIAGWGLGVLAGVSLLSSCCPRQRPVVALLIDAHVDEPTAIGRSQFADDLRAEGYRVIETVSTFTTPTQVRTYLEAVYESSGHALKGAILIGDIPHAYQFVKLTSANPQIPSTLEEVISYQFYSDLDGDFGTSPGYQSPGNHRYSYDVHSGTVDWEIWIGVLPLYKADYVATGEAINRYFAKNRAFRTGTASLPRALLYVNEHHTATTMPQHNSILDQYKNGQYAWTPWSNSGAAYLYFHSPVGNLTVAQGYSALSAGNADFFVGNAHGGWNHHGNIDIAWAEGNPIRTFFFWSNGCAVADLDQAENFLTSVLYSERSTVVLAKGTTNNSGGMGNNEDGFYGHNIATRMSQGWTIGDAVRGHVNVPLVAPWEEDREFHFATAVLLGDPTLRIRP